MTDPVGEDREVNEDGIYRQRATQLSPPQMFALDQACRVVREAFGHTPYLVGSVLESGAYRDVDVRLVLPDEEFDALDSLVRIYIGLTTSAWLSALSGLPVDFQIQQQTGANLNHPGLRNPIGVRSLMNFTGDFDSPKRTESIGGRTDR